MNFNEAFHHIEEVIAESKGDSDRFAEKLRRERIPHISFSQVTTIEFCSYRYYLQYIKMQDPRPIPDYFTKGKLLHQLLGEFYEHNRNGKSSVPPSHEREISKQFSGDNYFHLLNAYRVHQQNSWHSCELISVEHPFVMRVDGSLPPMVGVIDLILKQDGCYLLVDHKTGRNFYPDDELQVAIYAQYIRKAFGGESCRLFYDHYRWVNNLDRIRKPAFQRVEVTANHNHWPRYLARVKTAYEEIRALLAGVPAVRSGECFRCPYRNMC